MYPTPTTSTETPPLSLLVPILGSQAGCLTVALVAAVLLLAAVHWHWKPCSLLAIYGYAMLAYLFVAWHLY